MVASAVTGETPSVPGTVAASDVVGTSSAPLGGSRATFSSGFAELSDMSAILEIDFILFFAGA